MNLPRLLLVSVLAAFAGCATRSADRVAATGPAPAVNPKPAVEAGPFADEIAAFEAVDRSDKAPPKNGIVFYGSSSVRMWKSLSDDFAGMPVINRGFGGSRMDQCVMYLDRVVIPLKPRAIFIYAGDNDLAGGRSVEQVVSDTRAFVDTVKAKLPQTRIIFISIKPSPSRAKLLEQVARANTQVKAMASTQGFEFVDVATPMLGTDGQPRAELFGPDMLHMNAKGYELWTDLMKPLVRQIAQLTAADTESRRIDRSHDPSDAIAFQSGFDRPIHILGMLSAFILIAFAISAPSVGSPIMPTVTLTWLPAPSFLIATFTSVPSAILAMALPTSLSASPATAL